MHADKAYDWLDLRKWLRGKRIRVRIARKGIESSERLGRRRWVIERTMSWLSGYRRLSPRYERDHWNNLGFLGLAAAICCYKRYVRLTTRLVRQAGNSFSSTMASSPGRTGFRSRRMRA